MSSVQYVTWLNTKIIESNIPSFCTTYKMSKDNTMIHIAYYDFLMNEQFISIFRQAS